MFLPLLLMCLMHSKVYNCTMSLSVRCGTCAQHIGDGKLPELYAKLELAWNLNPVKQLHALVAIAINCACAGEHDNEKEEEEEDDDEEGG